MPTPSSDKLLASLYRVTQQITLDARLDALAIIRNGEPSEIRQALLDLVSVRHRGTWLNDGMPPNPALAMLRGEIAWRLFDAIPKADQHGLMRGVAFNRSWMQAFPPADLEPSGFMLMWNSIQGLGQRTKELWLRSLPAPFWMRLSPLDHHRLLPGEEERLRILPLASKPTFVFSMSANERLMQHTVPMLHQRFALMLEPGSDWSRASIEALFATTQMPLECTPLPSLDAP